MATCDGMKQAVRSHLRQYVDRASVEVLACATPNCWQLKIDTYFIRLNEKERQEVQHVIDYTRLNGSNIFVEFRP
jgi:hypothetical protein